MSLSVDGVWKVGVWAQTVWADGVWREGDAPAAQASDTHDGGTYDDFKKLKRQAKLYEQGREQRDSQADDIASEIRQVLLPPKPDQIELPAPAQAKTVKPESDDDEVISRYLADEDMVASSLINHAQALIERVKRLH